MRLNQGVPFAGKQHVLGKFLLPRMESLQGFGRRADGGGNMEAAGCIMCTRVEGMSEVFSLGSGFFCRGGFSRPRYSFFL